MKHRVLVVEDNPFGREMLCDWLDLNGFEARSACNLEDAFAAVEQEPPEVILLDVQLGSDDGLSLAAWIREDQSLRHVPVIAVTAHAMIAEQERVMQAGCNACISKPIEFALLESQLRKWLAVAEKTIH
jgi:two-component system, cell cycle response regulator DivK